MRTDPQKAGFSLVEVSLALLVAAVGMVSILALFPSGLEAARRANADTHEALFSEEVINSYTAVADFVPWANLNTHQVEPAGTGSLFTKGAKIVPNGGVQTLVYQDKDDFDKYSVRYELQIEDIRTGVKSLFLRVWSGEFGSQEQEDSSVFYAEIFDRGVRQP